MKGKRKVRWLSTVNAEQHHLSFAGRMWGCIGEYMLNVLCTLFCMGAAMQMLCKAYEWKFALSSFMFRCFFLTVLICFLGDGIPYLVRVRIENKKGKLSQKNDLRGLVFFVIFLIGSSIFLFQALKSESSLQILTELKGIGWVYLNSWSEYFGLNLAFPQGTGQEYETGLLFAGNVLCFFFVWLGLFRKQKLVVAAVPGFVLAALLLVGIAPKGLSLFALTAVVLTVRGAGESKSDFFVEYPKRRSRSFGVWAWIPTAVCVVALLALVHGLGEAMAVRNITGGKKVIAKQKESLLETAVKLSDVKAADLVNKVKEKIKEIPDWRKETNIVPIEYNFSQLDNSNPNYENKLIFKVISQEKPELGFYLVGFYSDVYRDGIWSTDVAYFEKEAKKMLLDPKKVSEELIVLPEERIREAFETGALPAEKNNLTGMQLRYEQTNLKNAYLPYLSSVEHKELYTEGDSRYFKSKKLKNLSFSTRLLSETELLLYIAEQRITTREKKTWEPWYEGEYVPNHYLEVPNGMEQVKRVAEELKTAKNRLIPYESRMDENLARLNYALLVAEWMQNNTEYSLELPELPKGSDAIEFFLGTSHMGFCMHYASASVMILRSLGVPARYVCGYVTSPFEEDSSGNGYVSEILDSNRHAWVEIYLNGIGWIPIEVTKGYSAMMLHSGTEEITDIPLPIPTKLPEKPTPTLPVPTEQVKPTEAPQATLTPVPTKKPEMTPVPGVTGADEQTAGDGGAAVENENTDNQLTAERGTLYLALFLLALAGGVLALRSVRIRVQSEEDRRLREKLRQVGNRLKIRIYNRRIYRCLVGRGAGRRKYLWDAEYEELLQKRCESLKEEEKNRFMVLAKEAAFSKHDFTGDEVAFCRRVYRKVMAKGQSETAVSRVSTEDDQGAK